MVCVGLCGCQCLLLCAQSNNHCAGSSHSYCVTQSGICAFSNHPIHSVICLTLGLVLSWLVPQHDMILPGAEHKWCNYLFQFKGGEYC